MEESELEHITEKGKGVGQGDRPAALALRRLQGVRITASPSADGRKNPVPSRDVDMPARTAQRAPLLRTRGCRHLLTS